MSPWQRGKRHQSWLSDTTITAWLFFAILVATVITDYLNGPNQGAPAYLTGLLGASGAVLFGAAGSDKSKRERDERNVERERVTQVSDTADRAEAKADKLAEFAEQQHPETAEDLHPPFSEEDTQ